MVGRRVILGTGFVLFLSPAVASAQCPDLSQEGAPPIEGLRFWLDASDVDANPATANPAASEEVSALPSMGTKIICAAPKILSI